VDQDGEDASDHTRPGCLDRSEDQFPADAGVGINRSNGNGNQQ